MRFAVPVRQSLAFVALVPMLVSACAAGQGTGVGSGDGPSGSGGGSTGAGGTSTSSSAGTGGGCPVGAAASLSFKGLRTTSYDDTMVSSSVTLGNPNDSTLAAYVDTGTLMIEGQNADWQIDLELHLEPTATPPLTITGKSFPNNVVGACFTNGAGLANTLCGDDTFAVTVIADACSRISGTFAGKAVTSDGFGFLAVSSGAFDVPIGPKP